jgi:two-component system sensor histidine kinase/response regulator
MSNDDTLAHQNALVEALQTLGEARIRDLLEEHSDLGRKLALALDHRQTPEASSLEHDELTMLRTLVELFPGFLWTATADGSVDYVNKRWYDYSGASPSETMGADWTQYVDDRDRERVISAWQNSIEAGTPFEYEYRIIRRCDGSSRWHLVRGLPLTEHGRVTRWYGCAVDVHEQRMFKDELSRRVRELSLLNAETEIAKQQVAQSERLFRTMCEASPELIWTADSKGNANYFNAQFYIYSGVGWKDVETQGWFFLVHPDDRGQFQTKWLARVADGHKFEAEVRLRRHDYEYRWHLIRSLPIRDDHGRVTRWCGSCTDIETHRRLVAELQSARDEARAALQVKTEFVANVSHELRTPLNGILGMVEVLLRSDLSPKTKEHVTTIREAGASLLSIINDILDFSKIEAGKMELTLSEFEPLSVIEGVADILAPPSASKQLLLLASASGDVPTRLLGDPLRLRQVLLNLCGNAIKFTDHGQIIIRLETLSDDKASPQLLFSVQDSGIGISEQFQKRIFEPFMQAAGASYRSSGGTGLGLSISKHLVELMGGQLFVKSKPGEGSTFSFTMPLLKSRSDAQATTLSNWKTKYAALRLLTLEPSNGGQMAICEHLSRQGLSVVGTDSADKALDLLLEKDGAFSGICLDTLRYAKESAAFLDKFVHSSAADKVTIIEIGSQEALAEHHEDHRELPLLRLAIPVRRQQIAAVLDKLSGWKVREKRSLTQTMEMSSVSLPKIDISPSLLLQQHKKDNPTHRALVADDNKINQQVACLFLRDLGMAVDVTADGIEAVSAFKDKHYDLVFLDCQMPGLDGFEACKIIKEIQSRRGRAVPIIAVTANAISGSKEDCLARGMDDYLSKPIDPKVLSELVQKWLGTREEKQHSELEETPQDTFAAKPCTIDFTLLRSRFNDKNLKSILSMFQDTCRDEVQELEKLMDASDLSALKAKAHAFKGACGTICAQPLFETCADIEKAVVSECSLDVRDLVRKLRHLVHKAEKEIRQELCPASKMPPH